MNLYDSLFSPGGLLNEQIARQIYDILPEGGPVVMIMDKDGNFWPSDSERFAELNIGESLLREVCCKVDDGVEPIVTQTQDCCIVATQLTTDRTDCGYLIIALPQQDSETVMKNINLIEMLLNQIGLIAKLIEKNNLLYELQIKRVSEYGQNEATWN